MGRFGTPLSLRYRTTASGQTATFSLQSMNVGLAPDREIRMETLDV